MLLGNRTPTAPAPLAEPRANGPGTPLSGVVYTNLDFLRAVAVLLVLVGHLTVFHGRLDLGPLHLILMGTLGVMLFFVHTCLVLMHSLDRQWHRYFQSLPDKVSGGWIFFIEFMMRRCFRIYPLSVAVILLILLFRLPMTSISPGHFSGFTPDGGDIFANLFLVQNLSLRTPLLGPMWSLPYELQMYLFLPWLFLLLLPNRSLWRVAAAWLISLALALAVLHFRPNSSLVLFLPCFLPGILAYQLQRRAQPRLPSFLWPFTVLVSASVFLLAKPGMNWLEKWTICLIIGLAIPYFHQIANRWLVVSSHTIAKYSYGIYLTHFFSIWFAFEHLAGASMALKIATFIALAAGLPVLFYHLLEQPMIDLGKRLADRYVREKLSPVARSQTVADL